ncbi:MAG: serine/threonine protein kinase [Thermoleophilia bacterium]|nr:serine/threonine protein kinase [Thermoleophilia bacterium]
MTGGFPEIEGFEVLDRLGRGGMGEVLRAKRVSDGKIIALKVIQPHLVDDDNYRVRFRRESEIAKSVVNSNVVEIYNVGETSTGILYIEMELIEGTDLQNLIDMGGELEARRALGLLRQVSNGLDAIHAAGLVHRDIKPGNILVTSSSPTRGYITDFGLTKATASKTGLTSAGHFVGTIDYIAPEQIQDEPVDARADVYGLACVFFHALTGQPPFPRSDSTAKMWAHVHDSPPDLAESSNPDIRLVAGAFARALAKDPEERFPSAGDFAAAVEAALDGEAVTRKERYVGVGDAARTEVRASKIATGENSRPPNRRRWLLGLVLGIFLCLAIASFLLMLGGRGDDSSGLPDTPLPNSAGLFPAAAEGQEAKQVTADGKKQTNLALACSPTGDHCQKIYLAGSRLMLSMTNPTIGLGIYNICVENPAGESECNAFGWKDGDQDTNKVDFNKHFEAADPGEYGVTWTKDGDRIGKTIEFRFLTEPEPVSESEPVSAKSPISTEGIGAVLVGMTVNEAENAGGIELRPTNYSYGSCRVWESPSIEHVGFMFTNKTLARIDVANKETKTLSGIGVGSTSSEVLDEYGDRASIAPSVYRPQNQVVTYTPEDSSDKTRVNFQIIDGIVDTFAAGRLPEVDYVEGCF